MDISTLKELPHHLEVNPDDWMIVHPNLRILAYELIEYCESRNLPLVITSIIRPMIPNISKTNIHSKARAFDVSVGLWELQDCLNCEKYFNENYDKIGAIGIGDGLPRACLFESPMYNKRGTGSHLHFQCKP
jgi:hypothetical protein